MAIGLCALLWIFVTVGGRDVFVHEVLSEAYDSQAEHLLRGDVAVDRDAIRNEAMMVNGKAQMYFGPFPALLRIPLNFVYPEGRAHWSRISVFCAAVIAVFAFAGLLGTALARSALSRRGRAWVGNACVIGLAFGSPLLFLLGEPSIYNEAIIWGFAWSIAALLFAYRWANSVDSSKSLLLLGFSLSAAAALLSRVTFGLPFLLIAPLLALRVTRENRLGELAALIGPILVGLLCYLALSYARFGNFVGVAFEHYVNKTHRDFVLAHGMFSPRRIGFCLDDYFTPRLPDLEPRPPFFKTAPRYFEKTSLSSLPFSETYLPVTCASPWLVLGAAIGALHLVWPRQCDWLTRGMAAALFVQFAAILCYFIVNQRYATDPYPFLIFCLVIFLRAGGAALLRTRHVIVGLVAVSIVINSLSTISWLVDCDRNVRARTRETWRSFLRQRVTPMGDRGRARIQ